MKADHLSAQHEDKIRTSLAQEKAFLMRSERLSCLKLLVMGKLGFEHLLLRVSMSNSGRRPSYPANPTYPTRWLSLSEGDAGL
jgi:hypothetical protein